MRVKLEIRGPERHGLITGGNVLLEVENGIVTLWPEGHRYRGDTSVRVDGGIDVSAELEEP